MTKDHLESIGSYIATHLSHVTHRTRLPGHPMGQTIRGWVHSPLVSDRRGTSFSCASVSFPSAFCSSVVVRDVIAAPPFLMVISQ